MFPYCCAVWILPVFTLLLIEENYKEPKQYCWFGIKSRAYKLRELVLCNARGKVDQYLTLWISNSSWKHYLKWLFL